MSVGAVLLIVIVLLLLGALPMWPYSQTWVMRRRACLDWFSSPC